MKHNKRNLKGQYSRYNYTRSFLLTGIWIGFLSLIVVGNIYAFTVENKTVYTTHERVLTLVDETRPDILRKIAECESNDSHFDNEGNVIRGFSTPQDIGRYQINLDYWGDTAKGLGLDLFDEVENYRFALWLYHEYGSVPWVHSSKCWIRK